MRILINHLSEVPVFLSDEEEQTFWDSHGLSDQVFEDNLTSEILNIKVIEFDIEVLIINIPLSSIEENGVITLKTSQDTREELEKMKEDIRELSKKASKSQYSKFTINFSTRKIVKRSI